MQLISMYKLKRLGFVALLLLTAQNFQGQDIKVYGKVYNARNHVPVAGALVETVMTDREVFTDSAGGFAFDIPGECTQLLVSHINFDKKEVDLKGSYWKRPVNIGLKDSIWRQNAEGPNAVKILTSETEYRQCIIKRGHKYYVDKDYDVIYVRTNQGDTIRFNKRFPGRINNDGVIGQPQAIIKYDIVPDSIIFNKKAMVEAIWKDGVRYEFITQDTIGYICHSTDYLTIPFTGLNQIKVRHSSSQAKAGIAFAVIGPVTVGILIYAIAKSFDGWDSGWTIK